MQYHVNVRTTTGLRIVKWKHRSVDEHNSMVPEYDADGRLGYAMEWELSDGRRIQTFVPCAEIERSLDPKKGENENLQRMTDAYDMLHLWELKKQLPDYTVREYLERIGWHDPYQ